MDIIFGSSGFIGSNLAEYILKKYGKNSIIKVSKSKRSNIKNFFFHKIDLRNKEKLLKISIKNIKNVYICAGVSKTFIKNKSEGKKQIKTNKLILKNIIEFCKTNKVSQVTFLSSSTVYSDYNKFPLSENQKIKPKTYLGLSKKLNEEQLKKLSKEKDIKVLILRIFTVYGKRMRKDQFIKQTFKKIRKNKKIILWNPNTYRNFIFVEDLVKIIDILSNKNTKNFDIINVATKKSFKIKYVFNLISKILKKKKKIEFSTNSNNFNHFSTL